MTTPGNGDGPGPADPADHDPLAPTPGLPVLRAPYAVRPRRRVFPGRPDQVRHARRFVGRALHGCPVTDTAVLLTSELASNAVQHTATRDGGTFEVIACRADAAAAVAVIGDAAATTPAPREARPGDLKEHGMASNSSTCSQPIGAIGAIGSSWRLASRAAMTRRARPPADSCGSASTGTPPDRPGQPPA
jgi:hypothetical protein